MIFINVSIGFSFEADYFNVTLDYLLGRSDKKN